MQRCACAMNVILALNSNYACALSYTGIHTDSNDNTIYHIPFNGKH